MREEVAQQEAELEALKNAEALKDEWERKARECAEEVCVCILDDMCICCLFRNMTYMSARARERERERERER